MASPYARIFSLPGTPAFAIAGTVARLPMSMSSLGIVLAVNALYGNWTAAGSMSAVCVLAMAAATPVYARLFDRHGQSRVGWPALAAQVTMLVAFALAAALHAPLGLLYVLAAGIGATQFAFGALVRTRWSWALRNSDDSSLLNTAYAFESAVDEVAFILGPILAAWAATSIHPVAQFILAAIAVGGGGAAFFLQKRTEPPVAVLTPVATSTNTKTDVTKAAAAKTDATQTSAVQPSARFSTANKRSALQFPGIAALMVMWVVFNACFSMFDVSMTDLTKELGKAGMVGVQLAMFAVGSCIGALIFGSMHLHGSHWKRLAILMVYLTAGFFFIHLAGDNLVLIGIIEVITGLGVAPIYATGNLIVKQTVPAAFLTEGLSWLSTSVNIGQSIGSSIVGVVLDAHGPVAGLAMPMFATALSLPFIGIAAWSAKRGANGQVTSDVSAAH